MKLPKMAEIPTLRRFAGDIGWDDAVYVMPDSYRQLGDRPLEYQISQAMAGPFPDRWEAAQWIVQHLETRLSPAQLPIWAEALERAHALTANPYHLIGLLGRILYGAPAEEVWREAGPPVPPDRKRLAAGERIEELPF